MGTTLCCSVLVGQVRSYAQRLLRRHTRIFSVDNGYNVVHFHLRGCGFSQIPSIDALWINFYGPGLLSKISEPSAEIFYFSEQMGRGTRSSREVTEPCWLNNTPIFHEDRVRKLILLAPYRGICSNFLLRGKGAMPERHSTIFQTKSVTLMAKPSRKFLILQTKGYRTSSVILEKTKRRKSSKQYLETSKTREKKGCLHELKMRSAAFSFR